MKTDLRKVNIPRLPSAQCAPVAHHALLRNTSIGRLRELRFKILMALKKHGEPVQEVCFHTWQLQTVSDSERMKFNKPKSSSSNRARFAQ